MAANAPEPKADTGTETEPDNNSDTVGLTMEERLDSSLLEYVHSFRAIVVKFCVENLVPAFDDNILKTFHEEAFKNATTVLKLRESGQNYLEAKYHLDVALTDIFTLVRAKNDAKIKETKEFLQSTGCANIREYADEARKIRWLTGFQKMESRVPELAAEEARKDGVCVEPVRRFMTKVVESMDYTAIVEESWMEFDNARRLVEAEICGALETPSISPQEVNVDTEPTRNPEPSSSSRSSVKRGSSDTRGTNTYGKKPKK